MNNKIHPDPNLQKKLEENKEMKIPTLLMRRQHEFNLEIFKKQSQLTIRMTIITAICTIVASIIGAIVGGLIVFWLNTPQQQVPQKTQTQINQDTSVSKKDQVRSRQIKTKTSAQGESSSKNSLKKP